MLDHSLIVYGSGMSDGQAHNAYPLPLALVGGAGGADAGNRFVVAPDWTPIANLWLSVADMLRQPLERVRREHGPHRSLTRDACARTVC